MSKQLTLLPRLSEQTYALSQSRVYVFEVPKDANKHAVARAVSAQFDVTIADVNVVNVKGKTKRTVSLTGKRRRNTDGVRSDIKKAYVKLAEGFKLPVFAAVEEAEAEQKAVQDKADKAAAKAKKAEK